MPPHTDTVCLFFLHSLSIIVKKYLSVLQVNGTVVVPPVTSINGIKIYLSGKFVVLETSFGLRVRFSGDHHADVTVPTSYNGLLCGMCGKNQNDLLVVFVPFQTRNTLINIIFETENLKNKSNIFTQKLIFTIFNSN